MEIINTTFKDLYIINITPHKDLRGQFVKQFSKSVFESHNLRGEFCESFYSISQKGVIRGVDKEQSFRYLREEDTGYFSGLSGSIHCDDINIDTLMHETGHALHYYLTDYKTIYTAMISI